MRRHGHQRLTVPEQVKALLKLLQSKLGGWNKTLPNFMLYPPLNGTLSDGPRLRVNLPE